MPTKKRTFNNHQRTRGSILGGEWAGAAARYKRGRWMRKGRWRWTSCGQVRHGSVASEGGPTPFRWGELPGGPVLHFVEALATIQWPVLGASRFWQCLRRKAGLCDPGRCCVVPHKRVCDRQLVVPCNEPRNKETLNLWVVFPSRLVDMALVS